MTDIKASHISLRGTNGEMTKLSDWTFGDFAANLVAGGLNMVGGYYLTLEKDESGDNPTLTLVATGAETGTKYPLATATSSQTIDVNTTYHLEYENNELSLVGSDESVSKITIVSGSSDSEESVTYSLTYDNATNMLSLVDSNGEEHGSFEIVGNSDSDTNTTYTLTLDAETNELVFDDNDDTTQPTRIKVKETYLDDNAFLKALIA